MQVYLAHLPHRPAARDGGAVVAVAHKPHGLVDDVVARAEDVLHLVVAVAHDRFLESDEVRVQSAEALHEDRPAFFPSTVPPP